MRTLAVLSVALVVALCVAGWALSTRGAVVADLKAERQTVASLRGQLVDADARASQAVTIAARQCAAESSDAFDNGYRLGGAICGLQ